MEAMEIQRNNKGSREKAAKQVNANKYGEREGGKTIQFQCQSDSKEDGKSSEIITEKPSRIVEGKASRKIKSSKTLFTNQSLSLSLSLPLSPIDKISIENRTKVLPPCI